MADHTYLALVADSEYNIHHWIHSPNRAGVQVLRYSQQEGGGTSRLHAGICDGISMCYESRNRTFAYHFVLVYDDVTQKCTCVRTIIDFRVCAWSSTQSPSMRNKFSWITFVPDRY